MHYDLIIMYYMENTCTNPLQTDSVCPKYKNVLKISIRPQSRKVLYSPGHNQDTGFHAGNLKNIPIGKEYFLTNLMKKTSIKVLLLFP